MCRNKILQLSAALACFGTFFASEVTAGTKNPVPIRAQHAHPWVDDYKITLASASDVAARRNELIDIIWGPAGFPTGESQLLMDAASPIADLENLERVEHLQTSMKRVNSFPDVLVSSYLFIPVSKRNRLVVVHYGHGCPVSFNAQGDGLKATIKALLRDGYGVLASLMPFNEQCEPNGHDLLFTGEQPRPFHYFLEPLAKALNYVVQHYPAYEDFSMVGLSGGGWTTSVYAAIDPRVRISFQVAGSIPLYLRPANFHQDAEQYWPTLYSRAGYPELYVLGSTGPGRKQIQILNRHDLCCFRAQDHDPTLPHVKNQPANQRDFDSSVRSYERRVNSTLAALGSGSFRVVIFDEPGKHLIPDYVLNDVILDTLNTDNGRM